MNKNKMYIALILAVLFPYVVCQDPSCVVQRTMTTGSVSFSFQHKTTKYNTSVDYDKFQRSNDVYFQLVHYDNDKYGHYVAFSENNQTRSFRNNSLTQIEWSGVYCVSQSYKPKELSKLWVKNYTGEHPLEMTDNETTKNFTASATLKCQSTYCYVYNLETNFYDNCAEPKSFGSSIGIKANFSITPTPQGYEYVSACYRAFTYTNETTSCTSPSLDAYAYNNIYLNVTLNDVASATYPTKVKNLVRKNYLKSSDGSFYADSQYYSVCGEECTVLPISS